MRYLQGIIRWIDTLESGRQFGGFPLISAGFTFMVL